MRSCAGRTNGAPWYRPLRGTLAVRRSGGLAQWFSGGAICLRRPCPASSPGRPAGGQRGTRARPLEDYYTGLGPLPAEDVLDKLRQIRENLAEGQPSSAPAATGGSWSCATRICSWQSGAPDGGWPGLCGHPLACRRVRAPGSAASWGMPRSAAFGNDENGHISYLATANDPTTYRRALTRRLPQGGTSRTTDGRAPMPHPASTIPSLTTSPAMGSSASPASRDGRLLLALLFPMHPGPVTGAASSA
jgi:hypothetical protein